MDVIGMIKAGFKAFSDFVGLTKFLHWVYRKTTQQKIDDMQEDLDREEEDFKNNGGRE